MAEPVDKNYLASLDRRITEHDAKLTSVQRDYTEVSHEIKELLNRLNNGLSPSVNKVRDDNAEIKGQIKDLSHDFEIGMRDMKTTVRESAELTRSMLNNFEAGRLGPVEKEVGFMKKTFIYGLVGAFIVFAGQRGLSIVYDKIFKNEAAVAGKP